jgi:hypothetical protein
MCIVTDHEESDIYKGIPQVSHVTESDIYVRFEKHESDDSASDQIPNYQEG